LDEMMSVWQRHFALLWLYAAVLLAAYWMAFQLRFDFDVPERYEAMARRGWMWSLPIKLLALLLFRQFTGLLGYFGLPDVRRVFLAMSTASLVLLAIYQCAVSALMLPRGVILSDYVLSTVGIVCLRVGFRLLHERSGVVSQARRAGVKRVAIIGAGDVGASLVKDLLSRRGLGRTPVAIFDDDPQKWQSEVHGVPVVGRPETLRDSSLRLNVDEAIIAMPSAKAARLKEIIRLLQMAHLRFGTVPSLEQLAAGSVRVSQLRPVEIQDLLCRVPVELDAASIEGHVRDRRVVVTGAGGSIGAELCRQIGDWQPRSLLMLDQSEVQLFPIEQEMLCRGCRSEITPAIANILDEPRLRELLSSFRPDLIFHAAAHKHVPMMESQPGEALKNNSFGTARLATLAREYGVDRFVLISTDKAINPTSVMGASKRLAEIYLQALAATQPNGTKFMAVRFGNVLGSSGSVIPVFTRQIAEGGPVTVTHPDVTRYFMTIPEAVGLVLQSAFMGHGGEIFVLDMGRPVKIADLARQLIELSGLVPDEDIEIRFTGLRPGEKLFEELSHRTENHQPTAHPKVMRFVSQPRPLAEGQAQFAALEALLDKSERNQIKQRIKELVPEYQPYLV